MKKSIFKDNLGNIHFGLIAPTEFSIGTNTDIEEILNNLDGRKLWRCTVCNDLSINIDPPKECPTCHIVDAYVEIELNEFKKLIEIL